jgi:hypothetical protein
MPLADPTAARTLAITDAKAAAAYNWTNAARPLMTT